MKRTPLKLKSIKQIEKDKHWKGIADQKAIDLSSRCQWCGSLGTRIWGGNPWNYLSGHHIIPRRFNIHTYDNCYICHEIPCHLEIEDNNIDVRIYPNKKTWDMRNEINETERVKCHSDRQILSILPQEPKEEGMEEVPLADIKNQKAHIMVCISYMETGALNGMIA